LITWRSRRGIESGSAMWGWCEAESSAALRRCTTRRIIGGTNRPAGVSFLTLFVAFPARLDLSSWRFSRSRSASEPIPRSSVSSMRSSTNASGSRCRSAGHFHPQDAHAGALRGSNVSQAIYGQIRDKIPRWRHSRPSRDLLEALSDGEGSERGDGSAVSVNFFQTLGLNAMIGRVPNARRWRSGPRDQLPFAAATISRRHKRHWPKNTH
jgi:hypothetical protein